MICYAIISGSLILNLFVHTHDDVLYPKYLVCTYVLPMDDSRRPKNVGEIIMKDKFLCMNMYN
jgi:hypothetical protein